MAHAFAERAGFEVRSAGSHAESRIHPEVVEAMREVGFDLSGRVPHQLTDEDVEWADLVVTMGCGDACPVLPGKRYLDWKILDPMGLRIEVVRRSVTRSPVSSTSCAYPSGTGRVAATASSWFAW